MSERSSFRLLPIKQVDVYREVFAQLDALVRGERPGSRLPSERALAEQLHVSRVSVREAMRALESMGKVEIRRNSGVFVAEPDGVLSVEQLWPTLAADNASLQWLTDVRAAIETRVVHVLSQQADTPLDDVRALLLRAETELAAEETEQGSLDLRFEAALAEVAGNPFLIQVQKWVHQAWIAAWSEAGFAPGDRRSLHNEHVAILEALQQRDFELAVRLMEAHVDRRVHSEHLTT
jgi:GntR family transcriptional regulator, transcriptional repressor for pyruvate dehydrogenase complex